jgi:hypothetical protein
VLPRGADPREEALAAFTVTDLIGDVARGFRAGGFVGFLRLRQSLVCSFVF